MAEEAFALEQGGSGGSVRLRPLTDAEKSRLQLLIRKLPRACDVRSMAERLLSGEVVWRAHANLRARVVDDPLLHGSPWRERVVSAWLLARLECTKEERSDAAAALWVALQKRDTVSVAWGCLGCFTGPFVILIVPLVFAASILSDIRLHRVREAAAEALGELRDAESTGALVRAIRDYSGTNASAGSQRVEDAAIEALPKVMERLTPEHYGQLEPTLTKDLAWLLVRAKDPLALEILRALEKVGDGGAVGGVWQVAQVARAPELRAEAQRILPTLEERLRRAKDPEMLLRAASGTDDLEAALLRPAGPAATGDTEQLLRPAALGEDG